MKIKVFYRNDDSRKELGELLHNETSRKIIDTLGQEWMYVNQISTTLNIRVPLVLHHLEKLKKLELVEMKEQPISRKTKPHTFYKIKYDVYLKMTQTKEENKEKEHKKILKNVIKITSIGFVSIMTFFVSFKTIILTDSEYYMDLPYPRILPNIITNNFHESAIYSLLVIIIGISIMYVIEKKKRV